MMFLRTFITAILTFSATNIDDVFLLIMFFSQTNGSFRHRHVIVGQYLGFITLVAISLLGFFGSLILPKEYIGLLGVVPIIIGVRKLISKENKNEPTSDGFPKQKVPSVVATLIHPKTFTVAAVTVANGGDNIGIYTSLFASLDLPDLMITIAIFLFLVMGWCMLGIRLARQEHITRVLSHYGHLMVPVVLVSLGIYLILENGAYRLLGP